MNWWIKLGCKLTGWSSEVLSQCSEASKCQLNKYTSALLILILIWGVTGFCFAQRYIGLPDWACGFVSLIFITIVIMIERQIILTNGKSVRMVIFRGVIAFIMAIVGSTIFDQTMFGKDINKQMANTIEEQVEELSKQRVHIIDEKLAEIRLYTDSINLANAQLQEDLNANPFIIQKTVTNTKEKLVVNGKVKTVNVPSVTTNQVPNPKQEIVDANNETLKELRLQEREWTQKKQTVEEDTRNECRENVGFLEELEAMWTIISTRNLAGIFYIIFFCLLMSLELFVVISKMVDKECDYDAAIKGAQRVRIAQFNNSFNRVKIQQI